MTEFNPSLPIVQKSDATEEPKVTTALEELKTIINGKIDKTNTAAEVMRLPSTNKLSALKTFTVAEMEAGVEFSATRPVFLRANIAPAEVGGVKIEFSGGIFIVPAGQKIKGTAEIKCQIVEL